MMYSLTRAPVRLDHRNIHAVHIVSCHGGEGTLGAGDMGSVFTTNTTKSRGWKTRM
jgi:hypothetical protein